VTNLLLRAGMLLNGRRLWSPLRRSAGDPGAAQLEALRRIVRRNIHTRFGVEHGFRVINDIRTWQRQVPVREYEAIRPYVEEQRTTGKSALTADPPVFYAQTSGSAGAAKLIPVTDLSLALHRREQALFSYLQFRACPAAFDGKAWGIMGAAVEGQLESGHFVGSVSGHLYQSLPRPIRSRFVVPPSVSTIGDYDVKYRTILCLALAEPRITYLGTPNPSTLLRLVAMLNSERDRLLEVLATGRLDSIEGIPPEVRAGLRVRSDPERARAIGRAGRLTYANVWPQIRLVTTWTGGSCGIAVQALRRELPPGASVMELGYQATECRGTMALDTRTSAGIPVFHHHVFEFASQPAWDAGDRTCLTLEQLEDGGRYYVVVTTAAGLYRYFMNDLVEVEGRFRGTPLLRFIQKGKGVISLTGEKLYEGQAIAAVQQGARQFGLEPTFFLIVADEQDSAYEVLIEVDGSGFDAGALAAAIDHQLGQLNLEYHAKRKSGRLHPLRVVRLKPGAAEAHKAAYVRGGQREAQFKPVILQHRRDLRWQPDGHIVA
jgi:hypothetical protein